MILTEERSWFKSSAVWNLWARDFSKSWEDFFEIFEELLLSVEEDFLNIFFVN